jgi:hypothetical protein
VAFLDRETIKIDALIDKKKRLIELLQEKRAAVISHAVKLGGVASPRDSVFIEQAYLVGLIVQCAGIGRYHSTPECL